jgi:hypothetical protein
VIRVEKCGAGFVAVLKTPDARQCRPRRDPVQQINPVDGCNCRDEIQSCVEVPDSLLRRPIGEGVAIVELSRSYMAPRAGVVSPLSMRVASSNFVGAEDPLDLVGSEARHTRAATTAAGCAGC